MNSGAQPPEEPSGTAEPSRCSDGDVLILASVLALDLAVDAEHN